MNITTFKIQLERYIQRAVENPRVQSQHQNFDNALRQFRIIETNRVQCAATDGMVILINPEYCDTLTWTEFRGVLTHEMMHVRLDHPRRMKASRFTNQRMANVAMDYEINSLLEKAEIALPSGCLLPSDKSYPALKSWEFYNGKLILDSEDEDEDEQGSSSQGEGEGDSEADAGSIGDGNASDAVENGCHEAGSLAEEFAPDLTEHGEDELAGQMDERVENTMPFNDMLNEALEGAEEAKAGTQAGNSHVTDGAKYEEGKVIALDSSDRWQDVVIETFRPDGEDDRTDWSRRSRRGRQQPKMFLPASKSVNGLKLALVVDISGSCTRYLPLWKSLAEEMVEEVESIRELEVILHDTGIVSHESWSRNDGDFGDFFELQYGGGTDHRVCVPYASALDVDGIVLFTDGETYWGDRPDQLVLCVMTPDSRDHYACPYGINVKAKLAS